MNIDPKSVSADQNYKLITGLIVPRPVAWITTLSENGSVNLAPFSAFAQVTHTPPLLIVAVGKRGEVRKDTGRNIVATREFVVNIATFKDADDVHASSVDLPYGESEIDRLGLATAPLRVIGVPRLAHVPAAMECRLREAIDYEDSDSIIFVADVAQFYVCDDLLRDGKVATRDLDPIARLGGPNYAGLGRFKTAKPPN
ncbi:flavin reductase family protein [Paraburkholderia sp. RL17-381-BIF-C]|jgi:flavin reductase (DIM6/NTAB) family NADH-FMN oxidoreductase RutF|uniref:flavin reductase family protein n=1 Tax=Paraburkholderia sp. RL17-381-BIF-C TaxID=3031635 RepID=UPI0038B6D759